MPFKSFNAKILLFGEHLINLGSDALSIPYAKFNGYLTQSADTEQRLQKFLDFLKQEQFDFLDSDKLVNQNPLEFTSDIPEGYGCGSSGAIVAACYDYLKLNPTTDPVLLRKYFSQMESFYHGKSSGTDPLVSYLNTPIRFKTTGNIDVLKNLKPTLGDYKLVLIDSGISRDGKEYIDWFMKKSKTEIFKKSLETELIPRTQNCIEAFLNPSELEFIACFKSVSCFQLDHFTKMIPANVHKLWKGGLESENLFMKICGAGGGGFFIGLVRKNSQLDILKKYKCYSLF